MTLTEINQLSLDAFASHCSLLLEHCDWALPELANSRPFSSNEDIQKKLSLILHRATKEQQLQALIQHPKLGVGKAQPGFSQDEQKQAGLNQLTEKEMAIFSELNTTYENKMGFPFIIAVSGLTKTEILSEMMFRLENESTLEFKTALQELVKIAQLRVLKIVE